MSEKRSTYGERLIQRGEELGFHWGQYSMLSARFGSQVSYDIDLRLQTASLEQITRYAERVLSAGTLDEVLAD